MSRVIVIASLAILSTVSQAATVTFNTDPFAGTTALTTPGRQVIGNELFIPTFDLATDVFAFNPTVFNVGNSISFANDIAANLPASGANVIVLQTTDNDDDPTTGFGAGTAANLIANQVTASGAGFFIYMNSGLNLRRLVFSTDLSDPTADLKILARLEQPTGADAIATLPNFAASNFAIAAVNTDIPEPSSFALLSLGLAAAALFRRSR
jgi:hypothetical protein